jgi:hypothetical protein
MKMTLDDGTYAWHVLVGTPEDDEVASLAFSKPDRLFVGGGLGDGGKDWLGKSVLGQPIKLGAGAFLALYSAFHGGFQWVEMVGEKYVLLCNSLIHTMDPDRTPIHLLNELICNGSLGGEGSRCRRDRPPGAGWSRHRVLGG